MRTNDIVCVANVDEMHRATQLRHEIARRHPRVLRQMRQEVQPVDGQASQMSLSWTRQTYGNQKADSNEMQQRWFT